MWRFKNLNDKNVTFLRQKLRDYFFYLRYLRIQPTQAGATILITNEKYNQRKKDFLLFFFIGVGGPFPLKIWPLRQLIFHQISFIWTNRKFKLIYRETWEIYFMSNIHDVYHKHENWNNIICLELEMFQSKKRILIHYNIKSHIMFYYFVFKPNKKKINIALDILPYVQNLV